MRKTLSVLFTIVFVLSACFAQASNEKKENKKYVASTSWVASIAQLAGLEDVVCIAPANLKHPPEYEITADDILTVANAKLFMQAGYERMMKTITTAADVDQSKIIKVKTTNTLENLNNMVTMLSEKAGTQDRAKHNYAKLEKLILDARKRIANSANKNTEVFAHKDQVQLAQDLGLNVVSKFGNGQLTSDQIAEAAKKKYALVIDNYHNMSASPIAQVSQNSKIVVFKNFPDHLGKDSLYNVIKDNLDILWATGLF